MSISPQMKTITSSSSIKNDTIQECRTFLRWVNAKLNQNNVKPISNLQTDLCDGIVLVELFEICSRRKIGDKFTKVNTKLRQHHIDRIALVLDCMRVENIELFDGGIGKYDGSDGDGGGGGGRNGGRNFIATANAVCHLKYTFRHNL